MASKLYGVEATIIIFVFVLYLYCIVLYCIVLYCIVLYLYCIVLYCIVFVLKLLCVSAELTTLSTDESFYIGLEVELN